MDGFLSFLCAQGVTHRQFKRVPPARAWKMGAVATVEVREALAMTASQASETLATPSSLEDGIVEGGGRGCEGKWVRSTAKVIADPLSYLPGASLFRA